MSDNKALNKTIEASNNITGSQDAKADLNEAITNSQELVKACTVAMVGSNGNDGYPNIKAIFKVEAQGMKTIWFSTNTSSKRVPQFINNPKACVYFLDQENFKGLMLVGEMEVLSDIDSKKRLWSDGCEVYYPLGVDDPDYSVLRFTAKWGNYYHGLKNVTFEV